MSRLQDGFATSFLARIVKRYGQRKKRYDFNSERMHASFAYVVNLAHLTYEEQDALIARVRQEPFRGADEPVFPTQKEPDMTYTGFDQSEHVDRLIYFLETLHPQFIADAEKIAIDSDDWQLLRWYVFTALDNKINWLQLMWILRCLRGTTQELYGIPDKALAEEK